MTTYRPRFSAEITPEQAQKVSQILPYGLRNQLMKVFLNGIISMHNKGGQVSLGLVISEAISIDQVLSVGITETRTQKIHALERKLHELKGESNND